MREIDCPPHAPALMESMRSVGYSLESALADLIDNSLSAGASAIDLQFRSSGDPYLALIDNGRGMSPTEIDAAMRHGSRSPLETRAGDDLGRFGLGLKTASMSQCRRFTVVSARDGVISGRCWDIDIVNSSMKWTMLALDEREIEAVPHVDRLHANGSGTIVVWRTLDRLLAGESNEQAALDQKVDASREHLALVFHRYISGEPRHKAVSISINGSPLKAIDPFLRDHMATQPLDDDDFTIEGKKVRVKPFILPHLSKLSAQDAARAGGTEGLRSRQGFYVYRNRRLIVWGTWFRLAKKDELSKLARVRVDIPNSLDHLWTLDIKKAIAYPPEAVRNNLRRTVDKIVGRSRHTYTFRGRKAASPDLHHGWERVVTRSGVKYQICRTHPALEAVRSRLVGSDQALFGALLDVLEDSFPFDAVYADMASDTDVSLPSEDEKKRLRDSAFAIARALRPGTVPFKGFVSSLGRIEPFSQFPDYARELALEIEDAVR
ncbi:MAG: hypothetical protein RJA99_3310 [Pseudomonadota bacterium]|jgi:hypothetical protein